MGGPAGCAARIGSMDEQSGFPTGPIVCRACGASLEVRVSFKGKIVWTVDPENPDFSTQEPELRGDSKEPKLVCSADAIHSTGFQLVDGVIQPRTTSKDE